MELIIISKTGKLQKRKQKKHVCIDKEKLKKKPFI